jgi:hypothetical protein
LPRKTAAAFNYFKKRLVVAKRTIYGGLRKEKTSAPFNASISGCRDRRIRRRREALKPFLKALPAQTGMAFVFIQYLNPSHVTILPEILSGFPPYQYRSSRCHPLFGMFNEGSMLTGYAGSAADPDAADRYG